MEKTKGIKFKFGQHKYVKPFRNKYIFTFTLFIIYALFLDDNDLFSLISKNSKLNKTKADHELVKEKLVNTRYTLKQLDHRSELERYAREKKMFKKDNEDVFVISER